MAFLHGNGMCTMTDSMPTCSQPIAIRCGGIGVSLGDGAGVHHGTITVGIARDSISLIGIIHISIILIITTTITIIIRTMDGEVSAEHGEVAASSTVPVPFVRASMPEDTHPLSTVAIHLYLARHVAYQQQAIAIAGMPM